MIGIFVDKVSLVLNRTITPNKAILRENKEFIKNQVLKDEIFKTLLNII